MARNVLYNGIDISEFQKGLDLKQAKAAGVQFAMLRAGYGRYISQKDKCFNSFYTAAKQCGLPVGAYWYSYATSPAQAAQEADVFLQVIKGKQFKFPVALDWEDTCQASLTSKAAGECIVAFCDKLEKAGYYVCLYSYLARLESAIDPAVVRKYDTWLAAWTGNGISPGYTLSPYGIWQYSSGGNVSGYGGRVDVDRAYIDYPAIMLEKGLNGFKASPTPAPAPTKTVDEIAKEVWAGLWGNGEERVNRLKAAGYNPEEVQKKVNETAPAPAKDYGAVALKVIRGDYGNGAARDKALKAAGYTSEEITKIQNIVNEKLK